VSRTFAPLLSTCGRILVVVLLSAPAGWAQTVSLAWDANTETDLAGYIVAYGTQSGQYTTTLDVGNQTMYSLSSLPGGQRYYFAVQAYNTSGMTSPFSAEVNAYLNPTAPAPTITSVTPSTGPTSGGTTVVVAGANFQSGAVVRFDGTPATSVTFVSATALQAVTPAHAAGPVTVSVTNPDSYAATLASGFTYSATTDTDGDGMPDTWESTYGLNPNSATGADGASGDPDGDGRTNLDEYNANTHPRGFVTRYFAEGANSNFFTTVFAFANYGQVQARMLLHFLRIDGVTVKYPMVVAPHSRATLVSTSVPGLESTSFSTKVETDELVVADRTMSWDASGYGAHAETAIVSPSTVWYLSEGATHSGFDLFYLVQNPNDSVVTIEVRYLLPQGAPMVKTYDVAANSRFNIWVDYEDFQLSNTDVSAVITSLTGQPIIVERAMYANSGGRFFGAGHNGAAVTAPATRWFLAEGATGPYFDLYVLVANPSATAAEVRATFLLPDGTRVAKLYSVAANTRFNIWVDQADPLLANTAVSTTVEALNGTPIIVERAMWWPGNYSQWREAHNSAGTTRTGTKWGLAEGQVGGAEQRATYVLIANTSPFAGSARVTLLFEDGTTTERTFSLLANSRFNVAVSLDFPQAVGRRFAVLVESLGTTRAQLVVERAMYWDANGEHWAAGTNAVGTILEP
jgi:hypothetical protein